MVRVLLLTTADESEQRYSTRDLERLRAAAAADRFGIHTTTDDAAEADLILFIGSSRAGRSDIRSHPFVRKHREKCFVFDSSDRALPFLPGIYACAEKRWFPRQRTRGGFFLRVFENDAIALEPPPPPDAYLFSFVGNARNARVRRTIVGLRDARGCVIDTSSEIVPQTDAAEGVNAARWKRYSDLLRGSRFILAPRGLGTSTWRLFESMKAGRPPVIVSDDWVRPDGPAWDAFSITIRERDAAHIPEILEAHERRAEEMGRLAREEWEKWFSREVAFHRVVEWCLDIARSRRLPESVLRLTAYPQLLRPFFFRHVVLAGARRAVRR